MPEEIKRARVILTLNVGLQIRGSPKKKWKQVGAIIRLGSGNMVGNIDMVPLEWLKQIMALGCVQFAVFPPKATEETGVEPDEINVEEAPF